MTIERAYASGWGTGEKLTSGQINQLDENTTYAADKRSGFTETIMASWIHAATAVFTGLAAFVGTSVFTGIANFLGTTVHSGMAHYSGTGVHSGTENFHGPVVLHGPMSVASGSFAFDPARTISRVAPARPTHVSTSGAVVAGTSLGAGIVHGVMRTSDMKMTVAYAEFQGAATGSGQRLVYPLADVADYFPDGATLVRATAYYRPANGHAAVPSGTFPALSVSRASLSGGVEQFLTATGSGWYVDSGAASTAAYQVERTIEFTPDQYATIDRAAYSYMVRFADEGGPNAIAGTKLYSVKLEFSVPDFLAAAIG